MNLKELYGFLLNYLIENIIPFWLRHSIDWNNGGLFSCIADDGTILRRDKYVWSNARALWVFSALVNRIADKYKVGAETKESWRRAAQNQFRFLKRAGRDENGHWVFVVDETGNIVEEAKSIWTDGFAIYGMTEYYRMSGDKDALKIALDTAASCRERLARPGGYKTAPFPTPEGMREHGIAMAFSLIFSELGHTIGDPSLVKEGLKYAGDVLDHFYRPDQGVLLEYLGWDNSVWETPAGRAMVPGHGIESLWFQIHNFMQVGDRERARRAAAAMRPLLEKGWDPVYGGFFHGIDVEGKEPPFSRNAEKKIWWVFTEVMVGTLMAYEQLREDWCLEWYWKNYDWAFAHFPVKEHGEWTQKLDRQGSKIDDVVALPVKDPFHLPRALIISIETLERLTANAV